MSSITITVAALPAETVAREDAQGRLTAILVEDAQYYGAYHYSKGQAWDDAARMLAVIDSGALSVTEGAEGEVTVAVA